MSEGKIQSNKNYLAQMAQKSFSQMYSTDFNGAQSVIEVVLREPSWVGGTFKL